jgi:hypothetical protein
MSSIAELSQEQLEGLEPILACFNSQLVKGYTASVRVSIDRHEELGDNFLPTIIAQITHGDDHDYYIWSSYPCVYNKSEWIFIPSFVAPWEYFVDETDN